MATKKAPTSKQEKTKFSKSELLGAGIFVNRRDALSAVVKDDECLTIEEAKARLEKFMKGKVN